LDVDIGVYNVGIVFQVIGIVQDVLVGIVIGDFHIIWVHGNRLDDFLYLFRQWRVAFQARLFGWLLSGAFRANGRLFAKVEKAAPAGNACMLLTEFRLGHYNLIYFTQSDRGGAMPCSGSYVKPASTC
jgi:hypothetical protein